MVERVFASAIGTDRILLPSFDRTRNPIATIQDSMPRYGAFVALDSDSGEYREIEELIDAPGPRAAAQQVIGSGAVEPGSRPLILIIEEPAASIFTSDDRGQAITVAEDLQRAVQGEQDRPILYVSSANGLVRVD